MVLFRHSIFLSRLSSLAFSGHTTLDAYLARPKLNTFIASSKQTASGRGREIPVRLLTFMILSLAVHLVLLQDLLGPQPAFESGTRNTPAAQPIHVGLVSARRITAPANKPPQATTPAQPVIQASHGNSRPAFESRTVTTAVSNHKLTAVQAAPRRQQEPVTSSQPNMEASKHTPVLTAQQKIMHEHDSATGAPDPSRPAPVQAGETPDLVAKTTAGPDNNQALNTQRHMLAQVQTLLASHLHYPTRARRQGWEGKVLVGFMITSQGQLDNIHLAHSSGFSLLDKTAISAMRKVRRISLSSQYPGEADMNLELPVIFQLRDS